MSRRPVAFRAEPVLPRNWLQEAAGIVRVFFHVQIFDLQRFVLLRKEEDAVMMR